MVNDKGSGTVWENLGICARRNILGNIKGRVQGEKLVKQKDLFCSRREIFTNARTVACYIVSMLGDD